MSLDLFKMVKKGLNGSRVTFLLFSMFAHRVVPCSSPLCLFYYFLGPFSGYFWTFFCVCFVCECAIDHRFWPRNLRFWKYDLYERFCEILIFDLLFVGGWHMTICCRRLFAPGAVTRISALSLFVFLISFRFLLILWLYVMLFWFHIAIILIEIWQFQTTYYFTSKLNI